MGKIIVHPMKPERCLPLSGGKMTGPIDGLPDIDEMPEYGSNLDLYGGLVPNKRYVDGKTSLDVSLTPNSLNGYAVANGGGNILKGLPSSLCAIVMSRGLGTVTAITVNFNPVLYDHISKRWSTAQATVLFQDGTSLFLGNRTGTLDTPRNGRITYNWNVTLKSTVFGLYIVGMS